MAVMNVAGLIEGRIQTEDEYIVDGNTVELNVSPDDAAESHFKTKLETLVAARHEEQ